jgi:hypothetical protein
MAAGNALYRHPATAQQAVALQCLHSVRRTTRFVAAILAEIRAEKKPVTLDEHNQNTTDHRLSLLQWRSSELRKS